MNRKVLIITYYWPPSGGSGVQRWTKFVKYLPKLGIDPVVLTVSNPTYASLDQSLEADIPSSVPVYKSRSIEPFGIYSALTGKSKSEVAKPSTHIETGTSFLSKLASRIRANLFIPDARVGWVPSARKKALTLVREHDIQTIITTGPPHSTHLIGKYLKNKTAAKWIADFRDPWSRVFYNQLLPKTKLAEHIDTRLEKAVLREADEVIVVSPSMRTLQNEVVARDYKVITNGFDHEDFTFLPCPEENNKVFTIRHIGTLSEAAIPISLFKALSQLVQQFDFRLEFIGNVHERVVKLTEELNLSDQVVFTDYLPHPKAIEMMQDSDLLLLIIPDVDHNELILTGKIFEYIATGQPILMLGPAKGDAADILGSLNKGRCFKYNEVTELENYLNMMMSEGFNKDTSLDDQELIRHPYSRVNLTRQLADIITKP